MLQRDYFLRILEEFSKALSAFLIKREDELKRDGELRDLYEQYVGNYDVMRNLSFDEALQYASEQWVPSERLQRLNMLAELLYAEGSYKGTALRSLLYEKAYKLLTYVESNSVEYSLDRKMKLNEMSRELQGNMK